MKIQCKGQCIDKSLLILRNLQKNYNSLLILDKCKQFDDYKNNCLRTYAQGKC